MTYSKPFKMFKALLSREPSASSEMSWSFCGQGLLGLQDAVPASWGPQLALHGSLNCQRVPTAEVMSFQDISRWFKDFEVLK